MNNPASITRPLLRTLALAAAGLALSAHVHAANYAVKIKSVRVEAVSGDIIIQVKPGDSEKDFSGKARVMLLGSSTGTNRALALLLTAMSLNTEATINVTNPPTYDDIQTIDSISLSAP
jgi:hypothetical protein